MLLIWLLFRHAHSWSTGPFSRYFTFLCAQCGATMAAAVQTFGAGSGSSLMAAERAAWAAADANAYRAVSAAGCPCCGKLQPQVLARFEHAVKIAARRRTLRLPVSAAAAAAVAIALAILAIPDLRYSIALSIVALATAGAVFGLVFALFSLPVAAPSTNAYGLWFSRDPSQGPGTWFLAQPGPAPLVMQAPPATRVAGFVSMGIGAIAVIAALVVWGQTFRKVHVISAQGNEGELLVVLDGAEVGRVGHAGASDDAPYKTFEVRTGARHKLSVVDPHGAQTTYDLDPAMAKNGWAVAHRSHERGLCLTSITWYYGRTAPANNDDTILNQKGDLVALPSSFYYILKQPPQTAQVQQGGETRTSLRALDCTALETDQIVPFKDAVHDDSASDL